MTSSAKPRVPLHTGALLAMTLAIVGACVSAPPEKPADVAKKDDPAIAAERRQQEDAAVQAQLAGYTRAQRITYPLWRAAAANCMDGRRLSIGASPIDGNIFEKTLQTAAVRQPQWGKGRPLVFINVLPGTPAYRAGIRPNDLLVSIGSQAVTTPTVGMEHAEQIIHDQAAANGNKVKLSVRRRGETLQMDVDTEWVCRRRLVFNATDMVNAVNVFDTTLVFGGLLRAYPRDEEAALIIAHELSHGILRHSEAASLKIMQGGKLSDAELQTRELDADALGLRIARAAGYTPSQPENIFRRLAQSAPGAINVATSHPTTPERLVAMRQIVAELNQAHEKGGSIFVDHTRYRSYSDDTFLLDASNMIEFVKKVPWMDSTTRKTLGGTPMMLPKASDVRLNAWPDLPALDVQGRVAYQQWLLNTRSPRSFALSASGAWGSGTGPQADAQALESCQLASAADVACKIVAKDQRYVLEESDLQAIRNTLSAARMPSPARTAGTDKGHTRAIPADSGFAKLENVDAVPVSPTNRKGYSEYLTKPAPRAFVVKGNGGFRWTSNKPDAIEQLFSECERAGETCWLYSVDDRVVWQRERDNRISRIDQLEQAH
ncbi:MAG: M48 family metallopeptidase [Rhodocyclaceae bacterium]